jgi:hypothetical protein
MNTFMTMFAVMGAIYTIIAVWAAMLLLVPSFVIGVTGLVFCGIGWVCSERWLQ